MRISPIRNEGLCWSGTTLKRGENVGHNPPDASPSVVSPGGWAGLMPGVLPVRDVSTDEVSGVDPRPATPCGPSASASIRASTTDVLVTSRAGAAGDLLEGVDRTTGQPRWSYEVHGNRRARLVAASDDLIAFVVGDVGELVAFDATTSVERWRAPGRLDLALPSRTGSGQTDPVLVRTGAGTGAPVSITALAPATGRQRWVRGLGPSISGAAATGSNLVAFERDGYRALDSATGQRRWKIGLEQGVVGVPGMSSRDLFLVGGCPLTRAD